MTLAAAGTHAADSCAAQATAKSLADAAKTSFLKECVADAVAASKATCNSQAAEKKLAGAAKNSFLKTCSDGHLWTDTKTGDPLHSTRWATMHGDRPPVR